MSRFRFAINASDVIDREWGTGDHTRLVDVEADTRKEANSILVQHLLSQTPDPRIHSPANDASTKPLPLPEPGQAIGFTGTKTGMTDRQLLQVAAWIMTAAEVHHGDCVGADQQLHDLAVAAGVPLIVVHPPTNPAKRAYCTHDPNSASAVIIMPPRPYLDRNRDIVDDTNLLVAAPKEHAEPTARRAGGTWHATRYARTVNRPDWIAWP